MERDPDERDTLRLREFIDFTLQGGPVADLVNDRLVEYTRQELPPELEPHVGYAQRCYENAGRAVLLGNLPGYHYVEGWAQSRLGLPVAHAWLADDDGNAYDLTWRTDEKCAGCLGRGVVAVEVYDGTCADCEENGWACECERECWFCEGSGTADNGGLADAEYIGIPLTGDELRALVVKSGQWGVIAQYLREALDEGAELRA